MKRRICWPDPDATCLEGGCGYCNYEPFRAVSTIRNWCAQKSEAGTPVQNRGNEKTQDPLAAFLYGFENDFFNAETRP